MDQYNFWSVAKSFRKDIIESIKKCSSLEESCFVNVENKYSSIIGDALRDHEENLTNPILVIEQTSWRGYNTRISVVLSQDKKADLSCNFYANITEQDLENNNKTEEVKVETTEQVVNVVEKPIEVEEVEAKVDEESTPNFDVEYRFGKKVNNEKSEVVDSVEESTQKDEEKQEEIIEEPKIEETKKQIEITTDILNLYNNYITKHNELLRIKICNNFQTSAREVIAYITHTTSAIMNEFNKLNHVLEEFGVTDNKCDIKVNYNPNEYILTVSIDSYVNVADYFIDKRNYVYKFGFDFQFDRCLDTGCFVYKNI